jgi:5-methylcytosine-specific restriction endonuclease McrA
MTKFCPKCNCTKSLDSFGTRKSNPDGKQFWCIPCLKEYNGKYYQANKERLKENVSKWVSANRETSRAIKKKWSDANPEKQKKAIKRWQEENEEQFLATRKKWRQDNKEYLRVHCINRRRKLAEGSLSKNIVETLMEKQKGICTCCLKPLNGDYHIDHIIPVAKGGSNTDENVQLLHSRCNMIKNDRWPWELPFPLNP